METAEDATAAREAQERLMRATTPAMRGGIPLRDDLRSETLKRVDRSGRQMRHAESDHHAAIARASRLGLSTREIAQAAGVTHGALTQRLSEREGPSPSADASPSDTNDAG